jgi:hypothetical protein
MIRRYRGRGVKVCAQIPERLAVKASLRDWKNVEKFFQQHRYCDTRYCEIEVKLCESTRPYINVVKLDVQSKRC